MTRFYDNTINLDSAVSTIRSYNPVWSGIGLAFTGTPVTGSYVKIGNLVVVQIDVILATVTNFGNGQYFLTLPFASKYHTDVYGGSVHDVQPSTTNHYSLKAHLSPASTTMSLWDLNSAGKDEVFDFNSPFILRVTDRFHMSFSYIRQ